MRDRQKRNRLWRSIYRNEYPRTPRGRALVILNSLALHLHPVRVPARAVRFSYTWGLGGLSIFMFVLLAVTGAFLMLYYVPSTESAYHSVVQIETAVAFGQFFRNLHRWSAHVMVILVAAHLVRVFFTGAYKTPRDFNWVLGVGLLVLTLLFSFTGYLLPWDQLSYWAVTVGTQMAAAAPIFGAALRNLLVGGPEVGQATLIRWYALHVFILPLALILMSSLHFWRIRKDGGISTPVARESAKQIGRTDFGDSAEERTGAVTSASTSPGDADTAPDDIDSATRVHTWPHLVSIELISALVYLLALSLMSIFVKAPLMEMANPAVTPNPAKAPWYFVGLQELLLHMHPGLAGVLLPGAVLLLMAAIPYIDTDQSDTGVWFGPVRNRAATAFAALYGAAITTLLIMADEVIAVPSGGHGLAALLNHWDIPSIIAAGAVPLAVIWLTTWLLVLIVRQRWGSDRRTVIMALFTMYVVAYIVLTLVGVAARGPGMQLMWPWQISR